MGRRILIVNAVLLVVAGLLGYQLYLAFSALLRVPAESDAQAPSEAKPQTATAAPQEARIVPDYQAIVQKDLFRPGRKEPKQEEKSPSLAPPPKLVGMAVIGVERRAYLEDPANGLVRSYRLKDVVSGFTVLEIQTDKAVLSRGDERVVVKLREFVALPSPFQSASSPREGTWGSTQASQPAGGSPLQALPPALLQQLQKAQIIKIDPPPQGK